MIPNPSIFSRGGDGMTTGGLDGYLGPEAQDFSNLPEHIEDVAPADDVPQVDCTDPNSTEPVCEIARAEREIELKRLEKSIREDASK